MITLADVPFTWQPVGETHKRLHTASLHERRKRVCAPPPALYATRTQFTNVPAFFVTHLLVDDVADFDTGVLEPRGVQVHTIDGGLGVCYRLASAFAPRRTLGASLRAMLEACHARMSSNASRVEPVCAKDVYSFVPIDVAMLAVLVYDTHLADTQWLMDPNDADAFCAQIGDERGLEQVLVGYVGLLHWEAHVQALLHAAMRLAGTHTNLLLPHYWMHSVLCMDGFKIAASVFAAREGIIQREVERHLRRRASCLALTQVEAWYDPGGLLLDMDA